MALSPTSQCAFPQDLDAATHDILQEIGAVTNNLMDQITEIEGSTSTIDGQIAQGCTIINQTLVSGGPNGNLKTCQDISDQFGLEDGTQNPLLDARILNSTGFVVINGVIFADGSYSTDPNDLDNVEILRRVYLACGRNLSLVRQTYANTAAEVFYNRQDVLSFAPKPAGSQPYTLAELQRLTQNPALTEKDFVTTMNHSAVAITTKFLIQDDSIANVERRFNVMDHQLRTEIVHKGSVDNSAPAINKWVNYGITNLKLSALLAGSDLRVAFPTAIQTSIDTAKARANILIDNMTAFVARFQSLQPADFEAFRQRIIKELDAIERLVDQALADNYFRVTVIKQLDTITRLSAKLTDAEIVQLLEGMTEVKGIFIDTTDQIILTILNNINTVGNTYLSNRFLNSQKPDTPEPRTMLLMIGDIRSTSDFAKTPPSTSPARTKQFFLTIRTQLSNFVGRDPFSSAIASSDQPFQGANSTTSPAALLITNMNTNRSFNINARLGAIDDALKALNKLYTDAIAKPISAVINLLVKVIQAAISSVEAVRNRMLQQILPLRKRLDAFISQYLSFIGNGTLNSSVLKCAINFNIGASTGLLDDLLTLINQLADTVRLMMAKLAQLLSDMINNLLCKPLNLINGLIGELNQNLPSQICVVPNFTLGPDLESALRNLRFVSQFHSSVFSAYNQDVLKVRAVVTSSPDKMNSFLNETICNSGSTMNFLQTALLNIDQGFLANPVGGISKAVTGLVPAIPGKLF